MIEKCLSQQLSLSCSADGNPTPVVELYFNGSGVAWGISSLQYQVFDIADSDFGTYVCVAAVLSRKYSRRIRVVKSSKFLTAVKIKIFSFFIKQSDIMSL